MTRDLGSRCSHSIAYYLATIFVLILSFVSTCSAASAFSEDPSGRAVRVVVGVFVTAKTSEADVSAIRRNFRLHHTVMREQSTTPKCEFKALFYLGLDGSKRGRPGEYRLNASHGDVVLGDFPENMNDGKTFDWFQEAANLRFHPDFIFKSDMDTAIDLRGLCGALAELNVQEEYYLGRVNDFELCGKFNHCPPRGCSNYTAQGCWIYMSGGFYGVSQALLKKLVVNPHYNSFRRGYEDMQFGKLVRHVSASTVKTIHFPNGQYWCHFKVRADATDERLSGRVGWSASLCIK